MSFNVFHSFTFDLSMSTSGTCFKVRFDKHLSRFRVPIIPTWNSFVELLEEEIFKNTDSQKNVCVQHPQTDTIICCEDEWNVFIEQVKHLDLIRLDIIEDFSGLDNKQDKEEENSSILKNKDEEEEEEGESKIIEEEERKLNAVVDRILSEDENNPLPEEKKTHTLYYATTPSIYKSQVKYVDEDRWCPFSQFEITLEGKCKLGNNELTECIHDGNIITWKDNSDNQCSGEIKFSDKRDSFEGELKYSNQEDVVFIQGTENLDNKHEEEISVATFMAPFFPNDRIYPYQLPEILKGSVRIIPVNNAQQHSIILDIDLSRLSDQVHKRAITLLQQGSYKESETLFLSASGMYPTSSVIHYNLACCYALQQRPEDAFLSLGKACEHGYTNSEMMSTDPDLQSLHIYDEFWNFVQIANYNSAE